MLSISAGHVVAGRYELLRMLGRGSMGEVWVAHHRALGDNLALKLLSHAASTEGVEDRETASARFRFEARIAARLSRKTRHIVRVTDYGEDQGISFLAMELLEGDSLEQRLLRRGAMSTAEVTELVAQIARALEQAHADGVVHRDLKPANVFLTRDEDGRLLVKLLDFGIARATQRLRTAPIFATASGLVFGTPGYMSPEQCAALSVDVRCDLWSLATIAYEALTGDLPVPGIETEELLANLAARRIVPVHERNPELPPGLGPFFACAFARHVEERFRSATELARALQQAVEPRAASGSSAICPGSAPEGMGDTLRMLSNARSHRPASSSKTRVRWTLASSAAALAGLLLVGATLRQGTAPEPARASSPMPAVGPASSPAIAEPAVRLAPEPESAERAAPAAVEPPPTPPFASPRASDVRTNRPHADAAKARALAAVSAPSAGAPPPPGPPAPPTSHSAAPAPPTPPPSAAPSDRSAVL